MLNRRTFLTTVALSSLSLPRVLRATSAGSTNDELHGKDQDNLSKEPGTVICAVGGLQRTPRSELIFIPKVSSDDRERVIREVAKEKPALLLLLGDQVGGNEASEWEYYDYITSPIRHAKIPTLAVCGDHEYTIVDGKISNGECIERWPETNHRPHLSTLGSIAFIGVDSNFDMLPESEKRAQQQMFAAALQRYDNDPTINGIVVLAHHCPYTNSFLGPNQKMITYFAEPFLAAEKTLLFLGANVHSYERFTFCNGEKQFVNSGGGGAVRRTVDVSADRPFRNDATRRLGELRPYNFLKLTITEEKILGEGMMLQKKGFVVGDRFQVRLVAAMPASQE